MKLLLRAAFFSRKHLSILGITLISMILLTIASNLEIFCLGVITQRGSNFFELFSPLSQGKLESQTQVSRETFEKRWDQLDTGNKGYITQSDAQNFLSDHSSDRVGQLVNWLDSYVHIRGNIGNLALFFLFVAVFKALSMFMQQFSTSLMSIRISRDLRQSYFEHLQSMPMSFFQKYNIGSLSARLGGDAVQIAESINSLLTNYFQSPITVVYTLIFCFYLSWQLSLLIFFGLPLLLFPIYTIAKKVKKIAKQQQKNQEHFATVLFDFLSGIQTIKVFAMEGFSLKKYKEYNMRMANLEQKNARYNHATRPIVHSMGILCLTSTMLFGLYYLHMSVSEILVYAGMLYMFYEPIKKFAEQNNSIQRGIAAAERLYEVISIQPEIQDAPNAKEITSFDKEIRFENVWFRYEDNWVLRDLNFTVNKGETVALVGPTGAGKSTIAQLLPRLYDVQKGTISIDGTPIDNFTQKSLRELISFVPQKPFLFLDTIGENIAFGRPFTEEEIHLAAQKAHAEEFILKLPNKYETMLSDTGKNLSGGQQQRLAIARALVKNAPILVMDEATSSLDTVSENHIKLALESLQGKMTQIIIAHRLSTIEDADKIVYLEHGMKIAEGTKDQLLNSCEGFKKMWDMMYHSEKLETSKL